MKGRNRSDIAIGSTVQVIQKKDQQSGKTKQGVVTAILTNSSFHPHGIKVRLADGTVGRVASIEETCEPGP
ncbi:MAG: YwbE family protein [Methanocalculus sp. MSAO_Arc1]|uniref:YwbE family protein n=1 Tax=Methanocalculus TaxID=71151 RepID=UPI000FECED6F|nr:MULTISPECIES: YwbE family protein [unclassified Methanocalculus]MCP1661481.1 putative repeat protein (TIGR03833 family) [Methanocalculus sp. AMF5]RQD79778.1 MAG: YwbE family protein [Methanocalculus sp. MSAO_Arc1]